jgi:hypothetical protein
MFIGIMPRGTPTQFFMLRTCHQRHGILSPAFTTGFFEFRQVPYRFFNRLQRVSRLLLRHHGTPSFDTIINRNTTVLHGIQYSLYACPHAPHHYTTQHASACYAFSDHD